jgi:hypothetical protein
MYIKCNDYYHAINLTQDNVAQRPLAQGQVYLDRGGPERTTSHELEDDQTS